jgi:hypothetical protein
LFFFFLFNYHILQTLNFSLFIPLKQNSQNLSTWLKVKQIVQILISLINRRSFVFFSFIFIFLILIIQIEALGKEQEFVQAHIHALRKEQKQLNEEKENLRQAQSHVKQEVEKIRRDGDIDVPRVKNELSLYVNISNIKWDFNSDHIKGFISGPSKMKKFDIDPNRCGDIASTDLLWNLIGEILEY